MWSIPERVWWLLGVLCLGAIDLWLRSSLSTNGVCNPGIGFGLSMAPALILWGTFILTGIFFFLWWREQDTWLSRGWLLMAGGGLINGLDRLLFGCVRDYLSLAPFFPFFPNFNLADMMLCLGVGGVIVIFSRRRH